MTFIYLRICDNDYGTAMQQFGEDFVYNYSGYILTMSDDEIRKKAAIFIAGYNAYTSSDREDKTPQEDFNDTFEYLNDRITVIKSNHWPNEFYTKYGSDDDHGSLLIDVYNKKSYLV